MPPRVGRTFLEQPLLPLLGFVFSYAPVPNARCGLLLTRALCLQARPPFVPATRLRKQVPGAAGQRPLWTPDPAPRPHLRGHHTHCPPAQNSPGHPVFRPWGPASPPLRRSAELASHGHHAGFSASPPAPPSLLLHACLCLEHILNSSQTCHPWPLSPTRLASCGAEHGSLRTSLGPSSLPQDPSSARPQGSLQVPWEA